MKGIIQAMLEDIYTKAMEVSRYQTVGEDNEFYITLEQLENILKEFQD